jgi:hypothetical protein
MVHYLFSGYVCQSRSHFTTDGVSQYVLVSGPLWDLWPDITSCCCLEVAVLFLWAPSLTRGRSAVCSTITQWFESCSTCNHTLLSHLTPPTWRARFPYLYPPEQGGQVIAPCTGFSLRRLLRLAWRRWRYSNPPPHGIQDMESKILS